MKKIFFKLSIAICFMGCLFLLTAGGGGSSSGGGKKKTTTTTPQLKIVEFKFGKYYYWCAGNTTPVVAAWNDRNKRKINVHIMSEVTLFSKTYTGDDAFSRYNTATGCFTAVTVPKNENYWLTCTYLETYPCGNQSFYQCYRWYYQEYMYSSFTLDCFCSEIFVDEGGFVESCS